jgi:hypothetical protein
MELLIVGAGAVGSTYGWVASRSVAGGGPETRVSYLVKPKHRAEISEGITLYRWRKRKAVKFRFTGFSVHDSVESLKGKKFDVLLITLPSDKLRSGDWLERTLEAVGPIQVWSLQTNANDIEWVAEKMGDGAWDRLVWGRIPIVSYLAPLPGDPMEEPGYAYYVPPRAKALWTSRKFDLAAKAAEIFDAGGLPSRAVPFDFRSAGLMPEALLRMLVAGLERSEWSFHRFTHSENLPLVREGIRETAAILSKRYGVPDPSRTARGKLMSSTLGIRLALNAARKVIPFDFEAYMRVHFTKVEGQMHQGLNDLIEMGKAERLPVSNLQLLRGRGGKTAPTTSGRVSAEASE